jgi:hypothetical protein
MPARTLKSVVAPAEAPEPPRAPAPPRPSRLSPAALREIAARADPSQPPAVMPAPQQGQPSRLLTVRLQTPLADAIADAAEAQGITQKMVLTRALAAAGFPVSPLDLEDRTPRRRRR